MFVHKNWTDRNSGVVRAEKGGGDVTKNQVPHWITAFPTLLCTWSATAMCHLEKRNNYKLISEPNKRNHLSVGFNISISPFPVKEPLKDGLLSSGVKGFINNRVRANDFLSYVHLAGIGEWKIEFLGSTCDCLCVHSWSVWCSCFDPF